MTNYREWDEIEALQWMQAHSGQCWKSHDELDREMAADLELPDMTVTAKRSCSWTKQGSHFELAVDTSVVAARLRKLGVDLVEPKIVCTNCTVEGAATTSGPVAMPSQSSQLALQHLFTTSQWTGPRPAEVLRALAYTRLAGPKRHQDDVDLRHHIEVVTVFAPSVEDRKTEWELCQRLLIELRLEDVSRMSPDESKAQLARLIGPKPYPEDHSGDKYLEAFQRWLNRPAGHHE